MSLENRRRINEQRTHNTTIIIKKTKHALETARDHVVIRSRIQYTPYYILLPHSLRLLDDAQRDEEHLRVLGEHKPSHHVCQQARGRVHRHARVGVGRGPRQELPLHQKHQAFRLYVDHLSSQVSQESALVMLSPCYIIHTLW